MTLKQRKLLKAYLKTGNKTQAAIDAGYSPKTARSSGAQTLQKIAPGLNRLMDRAGLSEKRLLDPIRDGLKAHVIFQGDETDAPDHSSRLKSSELAWKLRGHLRPQPEDGAGATINVNLLVVGLQAIAERRAQRLAMVDSSQPTNGQG